MKLIGYTKTVSKNKGVLCCFAAFETEFTDAEKQCGSAGLPVVVVKAFGEKAEMFTPDLIGKELNVYQYFNEGSRIFVGMQTAAAPAPAK